MTPKVFIDFDTELIWGQIWQNSSLPSLFTQATGSNLLSFIKTYYSHTSKYDNLHTNWALVNSLVAPNLSESAEIVFDQSNTHKVLLATKVLDSISPDYYRCPYLLDVIPKFQHTSLCHHSFFHLTPKTASTDILINDFNHSLQLYPDFSYYVFPEDILLPDIIKAHPSITFRINPLYFANNKFVSSNILPLYFGVKPSFYLSNLLIPSFYFGGTLRSSLGYQLHRFKTFLALRRTSRPPSAFSIHIWSHPWEFIVRPSLLRDLLSILDYLYEN